MPTDGPDYPYCSDPHLRRFRTEGGYRYEYDGRPYVHGQRCEFCKEFGVFADTGYCPGCEERIPIAAEAIRQARKARDG